VVILNNKYAGGLNTTYGQGDAVWTSTNGVTWDHAFVVGPPAAFESLTVVSTGFRITGVLRSSGDSAVWFSSNGITWRLTSRGPEIEPPQP
jgi:hypothetical protein